MSTVFLLLQTDPGRAGDAAEFLRARESVGEVAATSGPFDLIVTADVRDSAGLEHIVGECRRAPGLVRLSCCHTTQR
jgi:DNA-binding Lrp family transcriptional regulator